MGIRDAAVRKATGHAWKHWFEVLDAWNAPRKGHKKSAQHLHDVHGVADWWCQMIVVEYERRRGLRQVGQTTTGYQIGVHRTMPITQRQAWTRLMRHAFQKAWLGAAFRPPLRVGAKARRKDGSQVEIRRVRPPSFLRLRVVVPSAARPQFIQVRVQPRKTGHAVSFHEEGLPNVGARSRRRTHWKKILSRLADPSLKA